jgi:hypothetical protein
MLRRTHLSRALAGGSLATLLLLAGCGSSDDPDDAASTGAASTGDASGSASAAGGDIDAFCQGVVGLDAIPSPEGEGPEGPSTEDVTAFGEALAEPVQAIVDNAPEAAADAAAALQQAQGRMAEGDGAPFEEPATFEALATVEQAVADECGFTNVGVSAVDFNFEGVPATVPAGETNFLMTNATSHDEQHVMLVARSVDGRPMTPEEFLADPEGSFGRLEVLNAAVAAPHQIGGVTLDLTPGSYLLICPVAADEASPPHFVLGMIAAVTVV